MADVFSPRNIATGAVNGHNGRDQQLLAIVNQVIRLIDLMASTQLVALKSIAATKKEPPHIPL